MSQTAYSYIRMSSPEQIKGDSLRRQMQASQQYADQRGLTLDNSLRDLGISAYRGAQRDRGALGAFLALVQSGQIPTGSVLIVESLDRLSREAALEATKQFYDIILAGITIVTLSDGVEYSRETIGQDWTKLLIGLTIMVRAHEESSVKSARISSAWQEKRRKAASQKTAMTARCPAWIELSDERYNLIPERAAIVQRIFDDTIGGIGKNVLVRTLNRERVPVFGRGTGWHMSYVQKILESEASFGRYQPHRLAEGRRVPDGDPINNYFPAAVSEQTYWQAAAAREARKAKGGRRGETYVSLLSGLSRCGCCGDAMVNVNKGQKPKGGRYIECSKLRRGLPCDNQRRWPLSEVESIVLDRIQDVDFSRIMGADDPAVSLKAELAAARSQLEESERRRANLIAAIETLSSDEIETTGIGERLKSLALELKLAKKHTVDTESMLSAATSAPADLSAHLDALEKLRHHLSAASGYDLFRLRAGIAQHLREVVSVIRFFPGAILANYRLPPNRNSTEEDVDQSRTQFFLYLEEGYELPGEDVIEWWQTQRRRG